MDGRTPCFAQLHVYLRACSYFCFEAKGLDELTQHLMHLAPSGPHLFPEDQITDRSQRFLAAELVREKIVRQLGDELPYATAVEIESFKEDDRGVLHIHALILVERNGQKKILVGESGERLKSIGTARARICRRSSTPRSC